MNISRRAILKSVAPVALAAPFVIRGGFARAQETLVVVSWGGAYQEAFEAVWSKPFTEKTGTAIRLVSGPDLAKAKAQVLTGNLEWDIFDGTGPQITAGEKEGIWEPLAITGDASDLVMPMREFAALTFLSAGVVGYSSARVGEKSGQMTFADFWNTEAFPGRRGLRTRVSETLEMALLADGVAPKELYPLDVERGFAALDKIKPSISHWIEQTPQTISLMQNGEIDYVYTYNTRVTAAKANGIDVGYSPAQAILLTQYLSILKGSPRKASAEQFINFILAPEQQAAFAAAYKVLPVSKSAMGTLPADLLKVLPDPNNENNVTINDTWWSDNFVSLDQRFKEWLSQ